MNQHYCCYCCCCCSRSSYFRCCCCWQCCKQAGKKISLANYLNMLRFLFSHLFSSNWNAQDFKDKCLVYASSNKASKGTVVNVNSVLPVLLEQWRWWWPILRWQSFLRHAFIHKKDYVNLKVLLIIYIYKLNCSNFRPHIYPSNSGFLYLLFYTLLLGYVFQIIKNIKYPTLLFTWGMGRGDII